MLYDTEFLKSGQWYPQVSELKRFKDYADNKKLFKGFTELVYSDRFLRVAQALDLYDGLNASHIDRYKTDLNYHKLITLKTMDLVTGEKPTITVEDSKKDNLEDLQQKTNMFTKLQKVVMDISSLGDAIIQVYKNPGTNKADLTIKDPSMWTPIVDEETNNIKQHCIIWIKDTTPYVSDESRKHYELHAQIHNKGYYDKLVYSIKGTKEEPVTALDGEILGNHKFYLIKDLISEQRVQTGLKDFAIIHFANVTTSDSVYGISDYDNLTPIIAELEIRLAIEQLILDKNSHPTPFYPASAYYEKFDKLGNSLGWFPKTGDGFILEPGQAPPGYMEFSGQLQANHDIIMRLKKELFSLSEMGAIIDDEAFGASQGYEALETRMTNARMKARRLGGSMKQPLKRMIALISQIGFKELQENEISIFFNDGIPNNEFRDTEIVQRRITAGTISKVTALQEYHGYSQTQAEEEVERVNEERADQSISQFGLNRSNI